MVDNQVMCIRGSGAADTNYELELETDNEVYRNRKKSMYWTISVSQTKEKKDQ